MTAFKQILFSFSHLTSPLNYGRTIVRDWALAHLRTLSAEACVLDLGLGAGQDLINIRQANARPLRAFGLESYPPHVASARLNGVQVSTFDLERDPFPFADASMDVVLANQILEHTKELFWIFSEVHRVLKPGGAFIIGVPNLASLHNRAALLFGLQPFSMEVLGPHVRGFARGSFTEFIECEGFFKVMNVRGSNCYPLPPFLSKPLVRWVPGIAVAHFYLVRRVTRPGRFSDVLQTRFFETNFFTGAAS